MDASQRRPLPIGVFDSGVGGLTVLKALREKLPYEDLIYLGDTARLPYGTKSPTSISRYAQQATRHLHEQGIKLLVVACNTASAVALDALREKMSPLPVIGVVQPGATAAVAAVNSGKHLVMATEATVRLGAYSRAIAMLDTDARVSELACEMLVALVEEGWTDGEIATAIVRRYLDESDTGDDGPDCLILGCTHFPLLHDTIAACINARTKIVDSASTTADAAAAMLDANDLRSESAAAGRLTLLASDGAKRFARIGGRFLGEDLEVGDITIVDL